MKWIWENDSKLLLIIALFLLLLVLFMQVVVLAVFDKAREEMNSIYGRGIYLDTQSVQESSNSEYNERNADILSAYYAALYLNVNEDTLLEMTESGIMDGTYVELTEGHFIYIKEKLYSWCLEQAQVTAPAN